MNDANGNRVSETRPAPANIGGTVTTKFEYDANGRLTKTIYAYGTSEQTETSTVYDSLGKPVVRTDTQGRDTQTTYDDMGRVDTVIHPDGLKEVNKYDAEGRLTWVESYDKTLSLKMTARNYYDDLGRKTDTSYLGGGSTNTHYDPQGRVDSETGEDGITTTYGYDLAGRRTSMNRGGYNVTYTYDPNGNQVNASDANGIVHNVYDELNRLIQTDYPNSTHKYYQYDKLGRKTQDKDEADKLIDYHYDCFGKISGVTQHISGRMLNTTYGYDAAGNQVSQTDAKTHATTYKYDLMNRRINKKLPGGPEEDYYYETSSGLMDYKYDFNRVITDYTYDEDTDQLTGESAGGKIISINYDNSNRRQAVSIIEGSDSASMSYTYNVRDRLLSKTFSIGGVSTTLGYTRVPGGKLDVMTTTHSYFSNYDYDPLSGLLQYRIDNSLTTEYTYTATQNLDIMTLPNGVTVDYDYNSVNKLTKITVKKGAVNIAVYDYALGPTGNKTGVTESTGRTATWIYDDLYRLTNEQIASTPVAGNIGYVYDDVGNREQRSSSIAPIPTQVFAYDPNDRIISYSWDNNGNVLSDGRFNYTWNAKNELIHVVGAGVDVEYFYDGDGLRIYRHDNISNLTTYYVWDTENLTGYPQVVEEIEGGQVVRRYGYGLFLETVDIWNGTSFERFYVIRDGTNSVRMLLDSTGSIAAQYDYDAFGNVLSATNSNPLTASNPFGFHSEYKDPATNLVYLRARWYSTENGRFLNKDEFEGMNENPLSLNKYLGFNDNPVNMTDPSGDMSMNIVSLGAMTAMISIISSDARVLDGSFDSKEALFKNHVRFFARAAYETGLDLDVLASLGWSESGTDEGWNRNAGPDVGIMQINKKAWEHFAVDTNGEPWPDATNILNGARILSRFKYTGLTDKENGYISVSGKRFNLNKNEIKNEWEVAVLRYKGVSEEGRANKERWLNIFNVWPRAAYRNYFLKQKYQDLWNTKDQWLEK